MGKGIRREPEWMKLLILGHGRHGKDTVCEILAEEYGLRFQSSSMFCAENIVYPVMQDQYDTWQECFADRSNHRATWYNAIRSFNQPDGARLGKTIFADNHIYCGLRSVEEFQALKVERAFDYSIWVDASKRLPPELTDSCTVTRSNADFVLDNNGSLEDLIRGTIDLFEKVNGLYQKAALR